MVAGITHQQVLTTSQQHEWALQPDALEAAMQQDLAQGLIPFYLCATIGEPCGVQQGVPVLSASLQQLR